MKINSLKLKNINFRSCNIDAEKSFKSPLVELLLFFLLCFGSRRFIYFDSIPMRVAIIRGKCGTG